MSLHKFVEAFFNAESELQTEEDREALVQFMLDKAAILRANAPAHTSPKPHDYLRQSFSNLPPQRVEDKDECSCSLM